MVKIMEFSKNNYNKYVKGSNRKNKEHILTGETSLQRCENYKNEQGRNTRNEKVISKKEFFFSKLFKTTGKAEETINRFFKSSIENNQTNVEMEKNGKKVSKTKLMRTE